MPDTVIAHIITLGGKQPRQLTLTDWHGRLIIDLQIPEVPPATPTTLEPDNVNIEIPGVAIEENVELPGVDRDDNETPQSVEINDDLDIPAQIISTNIPSILMKDLSFSFSTRLLMNAFGISITETSLPYYASVMHVSSTALVAIVGKLASSFGI